MLRSSASNGGYKYHFTNEAGYHALVGAAYYFGVIDTLTTGVTISGNRAAQETENVPPGFPRRKKGMRRANDVRIVAIVEDDEAVQSSISSLLHSAGFRCDVYRSAEVFLDACAMQLPDCAIFDFRLPALNGLELQRLLNDMGHSIPIIMVSAYDDRVRAKALEYGAVAVLGKPFDGETLLAAIRSVVETSGPESA